MPLEGLLSYNNTIDALGIYDYGIVRSTSEVAKQERIANLKGGLVDPKDEHEISGNPKDVEYIRDNGVIYEFTDINGKKAEILVTISREEGIHFDTANLINFKFAENPTIRIILLLCSQVECVKSAFNIKMVPAKGFFKAKTKQDDFVNVGQGVKIDPKSLYDINEPEAPAEDWWKKKEDL